MGDANLNVNARDVLGIRSLPDPQPFSVFLTPVAFSALGAAPRCQSIQRVVLVSSGSGRGTPRSEPDMLGGVALSIDPPEQWRITNDLGALREAVQRHAVQAGLSEEKTIDLVICVNEATSNVLEHGGGSGTMSIRHDRDALTVAVTDTAGLLDPLSLPPRHPSMGDARGYGLWIIHQLCDEVRIHRDPGQSHLELRMWVNGDRLDRTGERPGARRPSDSMK